jgi:hypothetical protein
MEPLDTVPPLSATPGSEGSDVAGNGAAPARIRRPGPSTKPALVVVGIAAFLVLLFGIGAALTGSSPTPASHPKAVKTTLRAAPAAATLAPIELPGTPPADVLGSLVLPAHVETVSKTKWDGQTQYSAKMGFRLAATQAEVVTFYRAELRSRGWSISSTGAAHDQPRAVELLAQRASSDGWYWEVGVVVSPTTFGSGGRTDVTRFTLELFEVPDAQ